MSPITQNPVVGIDVSKKWLDLYESASGHYSRVDNNPDGHAEVIKRAQANQAEVCFEATGGHEWHLWSALAQAGVQARQLPPGQIKAFARSQGEQAKTDRIDARIIAQFGAFRPTCGRTLPEESLRRLRALTTKRQQLVGIRTQIFNQQKSQDVCGFSEEFEQDDANHLALLSGQIASLEKRIQEAISADSTLARKDQILRSVKGIGAVASSMIITELPELGYIRPESASALVGVAPFVRDSGKSSGRRTIAGGRHSLRRVLYQAAVVACRCNPTIKAFAKKLKDKGKPHKVVVIAALRKLIVILSALFKKDQLWTAS